MLKTIVSLAVPIILENIFQTLLGTADTYFAGQLGDDAIAAIGVTNLVMNVFISFFFAVGVGTSAVISRYVGRKDFRQVNEAMGQSFLLGLALGLGFGAVSLLLYRPILTLAGAKGAVLNYAVPYYMLVAVPSVFLCLSQILASCLRSAKDTRTPMVITGIANVLNIFLNYLFIRLGMGIVGLAAATTMARALVMVLLLLRLKKGKGEIRLRPGRIRLNRPLMGSIVRIGLPAGGEKLIMRFGQLVYNGIIISLGTASFVAHNIGGTIDNYTYIPAFGFGMAVATLVGISLGEEDVAKAKRTTFVTYGITTACR
jgi:putative MATE family efflux protein